MNTLAFIFNVIQTLSLALFLLDSPFLLGLYTAYKRYIQMPSMYLKQFHKFYTLYPWRFQFMKVQTQSFP